MMFCPNCGTQMPDTAGFCRNCGTKMEKAAAMAIHAPKTSFAPAAPVKKREFLRRYANGKTKTAAVFAVITMLLSIAVLMLSACSCLNTDLREIPLLHALGIEEAFEDLEELEEQNRDDLDAAFDMAEREMPRSDWRYIEKLEESLNDILDCFSIVNCVVFIDVCEEVMDEEVLEPYGISLEEYIGIYEDEFELMQEIYVYIAVGIFLIFAFPALFVLLGGLNKNVVLSVLGLVFSVLLQLALCAPVYPALNAAVLIVQIILCAVVQKRYKAFRSGALG